MSDGDLRPNSFWRERWEQNQIPFHQAEVNPLLEQFWTSLALDAESPVFVPLCGKSRDMHWLREQGHRVVGVELSPIACRDFFADAGMEPRLFDHGSFQVYEAEGYRLLCGDLFALSTVDLEGVSAVFDRASLFAFPAERRRDYARAMGNVLSPGARTLLLTFEYETGTMTGPPFSVTEEEVLELYGGAFDVEQLSHAGGFPAGPRFEPRGLETIALAAYRLEKR